MTRISIHIDLGSTDSIPEAAPRSITKLAALVARDVQAAWPKADVTVSTAKTHGQGGVEVSGREVTAAAVAQIVDACWQSQSEWVVCRRAR